MKKWTILCLFICFIYLPIFNTKANQSTPVGNNYLALSNLGIHPDNRLLASMIDPITVEVDEMFTLVLSYNFIGQNASYIDYYDLVILDATNQSVMMITFNEDAMNERVYVEFLTPSYLIRLLNIPIDTQSNYDAILYKGTYQEFPGFEPYIKSSETLHQEGVLLMDVDSPWSISSIKALFTAKNPQGQNIDIDIIEDTYSISNKKPGTYRILLKTTHNRISKTFALSIIIYDIKAPILSLEEAIQIPLTEKIDVDDVLYFVQISDNVDDLSHHQIVILEDTYSSANQVGEYHIKISLKDLSQNEAQLTIPVSIIDRKAPTASYPYQLFVYNTDSPLSNEIILSKFHVTDDVDGLNVSKDWTINEYNQTLIPGIYHMRLTTKDQSLNSSHHSIYIHVIDNRAPLFEAGDLIIDMETHQHMTNDDIIHWFQMKAQSLGLNVSHVRIIYNEYELANRQEGSYYVHLTYMNNDVEHTSRVLMNVTKNETHSYGLYIILSGGFILIGTSFIIIKKKKV